LGDFRFVALVRAGFAFHALKYESKSEAAQFADHLKGLIVSGRYSQLLPSVRKLASDNCVSTVTVHNAFRLLVEQGLLISSGGTRRPRIASIKEVSRPSLGSLLIVSGAKFHKLPVSIMTSLMALEKALPGKGFCCYRLELRDGSHATLKRLRGELRERKPSHLLFVHPHDALLSARFGGNIELAVLSHTPFRGSRAYRVEVPYLAVPLLILRKAKEMGHRHISFVDNVLNISLRKVLMSEAKQLGLRLTIVRGGSLGSDNWIHDKTRIREVCSALKACGATCVLFPQWQDFMTATSGFDRAGLEFPERLSVVVAYRNGSSDHYHGHRVTGCDIPADLAERIILHWLEGGRGDREFFADLVLGTWDDGETLRKPLR
jgi:hypothetical protein